MLEPAAMPLRAMMALLMLPRRVCYASAPPLRLYDERTLMSLADA